MPDVAPLDQSGGLSVCCVAWCVQRACSSVFHDASSRVMVMVWVLPCLSRFFANRRFDESQAFRQRSAAVADVVALETGPGAGLDAPAWCIASGSTSGRPVQCATRPQQPFIAVWQTPDAREAVVRKTLEGVQVSDAFLARLTARQGGRWQQGGPDGVADGAPAPER